MILSSDGVSSWRSFQKETNKRKEKKKGQNSTRAPSYAPSSPPFSATRPAVLLRSRSIVTPPTTAAPAPRAFSCGSDGGAPRHAAERLSSRGADNQGIPRNHPSLRTPLGPTIRARLLGNETGASAHRMKRFRTAYRCIDEIFPTYLATAFGSHRPSFLLWSNRALKVGEGGVRRLR